MNFDEYSDIITSIHRQLQDIAEKTADQAFIDMANTSNQNFVSLMKSHAQLVKLSSELTDRMIRQMENG